MNIEHHAFTAILGLTGAWLLLNMGVQLFIARKRNTSSARNFTELQSTLMAFNLVFGAMLFEGFVLRALGLA